MSSNSLHVVITQRKDSYFWLRVVIHAQLHPGFWQLSVGAFKGEVRRRIVQNEIFVIFSK